MKKRILLLFLTLGICNSIVVFGQKTTTPAKPVEKPAFAYLLATTDLDVKITVLNTGITYTVLTTDEIVKIGLDAGDNLLKITPMDGSQDGFTITKTADKPGNIAYRVDIIAKRAEMIKQEEALKIESAKKGEEARKKKILEDIAANMVLVYGGPVEECISNNGSWWSVSDFYISKNEVTQAQWVEIMGYNPSHHSNCDLCPIENISINEVEMFLNKLNARSNINYRLPTFWEWKFASRGGTQTDGYYNLNREAWYKSNSGDSTHQVMLKISNEIGLFDTYGNVREYVDHFTPSNWAGDEGVTADEGIGVYCPGTNPKRKRNSKSVYQNIMGGSYEEESSGFQEEHYQMTIGGKGADVGFRLAKSFRQ